MYLVSWKNGPFVFDPRPARAHRFATRGEADTVLGLIVNERWPFYESRIVTANVRPKKAAAEEENLF
jgi:hypothetical protein